jgi:26S proteasome regulatory subunit N9
MSASSDSRTITLIGDYLESEGRTKPELRDAYTQLNAAVQKKLWHQTSAQLLACLQNPAFAPTTILALQENVVARIYKKLAPLEYARWSIAVSSLKSVEEGLKHIESVLPHVQHQTAGQVSLEQDEQAVLLLQLEATRRQLGLGGEIDLVKEKLAESKKSLDRFSGVMDARVYASYYQASYEYSKLKGNPQDYYTNSLLYLTYTPLNSIPLATQAALASDIGLAALLGKNIYNFGELLQHPILKSLDATEYAWLPKLLVTFNQGNIKGFNEIFEQVKGKYVSLKI